MGLAVGMAENKTLAAGFVAAAVGAFILLRAAAVLIAWAAKRTPRLNNPLARIAIANLHRPGAATAAVVLSLGLGLTLFAALAAIEHNMSSEVRERIPNEAPAFFFVDIQPFELEEFKEKVLSVPGARDLQTVPSLRGPVLAVGGIPSEEIDADPEEATTLIEQLGSSHPDTAVLVASSSTDETIRLWDLPSRQLTTTLDESADTLVAIAFDPTNQTLVSGGQNQTIQIWQ